MMWQRFITLTFVFLILVVGQVKAGILESFSVERCAWTATHIVVIDEAGSVVESLKGNLAPGYRLPLGQLKIPTQDEIDQGLKSSFAAKVKPTNKRRILFLIQKNGKWQPAANGMDISMAWQEGEVLLGFQQVINPGRLILRQLEETEKRFYQIIKDSVALEEKLREIRQIVDPAHRAQALTEFIVNPRNWLCQRDAMVELARCGDAAEKVIVDLLNDETKAGNTYHADLITLYGSKFPEHARPWMMREVVNALAYWQKRAPTLTKDWWAKQSALEHTAYIKLYYSLSLLARVDITEKDREPIQRLIDFWKSQPLLESMGRGYTDGKVVGDSQIVAAAKSCLK